MVLTIYFFFLRALIGCLLFRVIQEAGGGGLGVGGEQLSIGSILKLLNISGKLSFLLGALYFQKNGM